MKFSLFFEIQLADASPASEQRRFQAALRQGVLADQLGYHALWVVEHHGMRHYSHSSAPEVLLGCLAGKTERVRLAHGVALTPGAYNHPIRVAERTATLDILSGGRAILGMGKSASLTEQMAFGLDPEELQEQWLEALDMIPRMWNEDLFRYKGSFYHVPPTRILPKPVQKPHPPLFAACNRPEASRHVGAMGLGALNLAVGDDAYLHKLVQLYREAASAARPDGRSVTNHFCCTPIACCLPDDREACRHGFRGQRFFEAVMAAYYLEPARPTGDLHLPVDELAAEDLEAQMAARDQTGAGALNLIGDPVRVRETVSRFDAAGVDELILLMQVGTMPDAVIERSMTVFAEQVMPHFPDAEAPAPLPVQPGVAAPE
jgi:alkanesulfonate monooxygenase SsuD/methylene tetrahydromethanopterin reductase-like flavin-dependent oxidoreductase (luciferase family)